MRVRRAPSSAEDRSGPVRALLPVAVALGLALVPAGATATPSSLFWAPSSQVQPFAVPHLTYDTYFFPGSSKAASYPVTLGVTSGVLPFERLQLELGFDVLLPTRSPLFLNAKLGAPEGAMFAGSPSVAIGVYDAGVTGDSALDVFYGVVGKRTFIGAIDVGGYVGSDRLLRTSSGATERAGLLAGVALPPIAVKRPWLQRVEVRWDVVTGRNVIGATGGGLAFVFLPSLSILTGPIFFFDPPQQPAGTGWLWSVQVDVEVGARQEPAR
ncbi:hypothetical protein [Anaeromyxobacter oryzae]|uniref:Uncharacterized protein n=1 Tax=Anaeromyxobacter oryzae TaxID=2918170 RepID=A0ABN6MX29_9BACT|nr:hypothetical protein [Anaeromyxobacter oryzae]BDG05131.1 hypothetical protein AMOR_41270 [Anaeromyxobacter oryzae]